MPQLCNSAWPQHTLQMFADHFDPRQTIPWDTINQGLLQPQEEMCIQTIFNHRSPDQLLKFHTSFYETISSEFLVQGNFKHTQFSQEHWYWWDLNSQPLLPKASVVLIELTWLLSEPFCVNSDQRIVKLHHQSRESLDYREVPSRPIHLVYYCVYRLWGMRVKDWLGTYLAVL